MKFSQGYLGISIGIVRIGDAHTSISRCEGVYALCGIAMSLLETDDCWDNDKDQDDDNTSHDAHPHLHVLPPHLLPYTIRTTTETLGRLSEVISLVLEIVQPLTTLRNVLDIVAHDIHGIVNLLLNSGSPSISGLAGAAGSIAALRDIRIVGLVGHGLLCGRCDLLDVR